jgi:hypothetical protein
VGAFLQLAHHTASAKGRELTVKKVKSIQMHFLRPVHYSSNLQHRPGMGFTNVKELLQQRFESGVNKSLMK